MGRLVGWFAAVLTLAAGVFVGLWASKRFGRGSGG